MKKSLAMLVLVALSSANADTCSLASNTAITSYDGNIVVRVQPGSPDTPARARAECIATLTKWSEQDQSYHFLRRVTLRNPERPLTAVITDDARFLVTFDDWCRMGETENAIVIYDLEQGTSHAYALKDFLSASYRETLSRSMSSTEWRGDPIVSEGNHVIYVPASRGNDSFESTIVIDPAKNTITCKACEKPK
jgi:hypothetical protein